MEKYFFRQENYQQQASKKKIIGQLIKLWETNYIDSVNQKKKRMSHRKEKKRNVGELK